MPDQSQLDQRYFVDQYVYNCPFCNRRHVAYSVVGWLTFDWTDTKECHSYLVQCHSCKKTSMHLTYQDLDVGDPHLFRGKSAFRFTIEDEVDVGDFLDRAFFYSVPTSFFILDERVPRVLRELLTEAEGCLKSNFLTGGSACARKMVYELAAREGAAGDDYEERIKSLKGLHPEVEPTFFDTLVTIKEVTSSKVHESAYDGWDARHLRLILVTLAEVLHELYVVPALREDRRESVVALKKELIGAAAPATPQPTIDDLSGEPT